MMIEKAEFFALQREYDRSMTHGTFERTRVIREGKTFEVTNYANAGPLELWSIQRAIEGLAASIEPEKIARLSKCPVW